MFASIRRLLRRLFGRDHEPPCHPGPKQAEPDPEHYGHGQAERPEDRPSTDWADRIARLTGSGDWRPQRLRSLPDEQKERESQNRDRGRGR
jgi:hypothetical protein